MSDYYRANRVRNLYDPASTTPYKLSRGKISNFLNCPRCFYLDRRLGVGQPPSYPYNLNSAVDKLLKKEFDIHRVNKTTHPLMKAYGLDAIPLSHEKIDEWRDSLHHGITFQVDGTNIIVTGGVDDIWVTPEGELIIVDYKSTSKDKEVSLDEEWQIGYKRQMEIYQWLFRKNGFRVSSTGYFVYCNGNTDREAFDGKLEFEIKLLPYIGDDSWVEQTVLDALQCLSGDTVPPYTESCDYCSYYKAVKVLDK